MQAIYHYLFSLQPGGNQHRLLASPGPWASSGEVLVLGSSSEDEAGLEASCVASHGNGARPEAARVASSCGTVRLSGGLAGGRHTVPYSIPASGGSKACLDRLPTPGFRGPSHTSTSGPGWAGPSHAPTSISSWAGPLCASTSVSG